jgi:hypothetical protein
MLHSGRHRGPFPTLLLCALLIGAHFGAALHAFEHDIVAPQGKVCSTCVTAAQLGAACVDSHTPIVVEPLLAMPEFSCSADFQSVHSVAARQRGPPAAL